MPPQTTVQRYLERCPGARCLTPLYTPSPVKISYILFIIQESGHQTKAGSVFAVLRPKDLPQLWRRVAEFVAGVHVAAVTVVPLPAPTPDHVGMGRDLGTDALPEDSMVEGPDGGLLLLVNESEGSCLEKKTRMQTISQIIPTCSRKCVSRLSHISVGSSVTSILEASIF